MEDIAQLVEATWAAASKKLEIRVIAPFIVRAKGKSVRCAAFLPDFGGPRGMIIGVAMPPNFEADPSLIECARAKELYYSFINGNVYASYDEVEVKEALTDWGFFGAPGLRPSWLAEQAGRAG